MRIQLLVYCAGLGVMFARRLRGALRGWLDDAPFRRRTRDTISAAKLAQLKPGISTKTEVQLSAGRALADFAVQRLRHVHARTGGRDAGTTAAATPRAPTACTSSLTTTMWRVWWRKSPIMPPAPRARAQRRRRPDMKMAMKM